VAIRTRLGCAIESPSEQLHEIVVGNQGPGNRDSVARTVAKGLAYDRSGLKTTGANDWDLDRLLDRARIRQVDPFNLVAGRAIPSGLEKFVRWKGAKQNEVPISVFAARYHRVVGLDQFFE